MTTTTHVPAVPSTRVPRSGGLLTSLRRSLRLRRPDVAGTTAARQITAYPASRGVGVVVLPPAHRPLS